MLFNRNKVKIISDYRLRFLIKLEMTLKATTTFYDAELNGKFNKRIYIKYVFSQEDEDFFWDISNKIIGERPITKLQRQWLEDIYIRLKNYNPIHKNL